MSDPMKPERIEEFRYRAQSARELLVTVEDGWGMVEIDEEEVDEILNEIERQRTVMAERDKEIERLRGWLLWVQLTPCNRLDSIDGATRALRGEAVPS